ncbi:MAG: type II toxin-antitoxin system PemK/MazF family toxin [Nanoarchaeota archaeon]|nr:MAG: type II toxin-antitoxin system PemK/MazF family toxin [Nanoarchaeota archaeon]
MTSGTQYKQGDILITPFPFTNLSAIKQRPVLVLSKDTTGADLITCGITSNLKDNEHSVTLLATDLAEGTIPKQSRIKVSKIFTLEKTIIRKKIASIKPAHMRAVQKLYRNLV